MEKSLRCIGMHRKIQSIRFTDLRDVGM